jgi:uncharacterized membrane protein
VAYDVSSLSVGISHLGWLGAVVFSAVIVWLVALGVTDHLGLHTLVILGAVFGAAGLFLLVFAEIMRYVREADRKGGDNP